MKITAMRSFGKAVAVLFVTVATMSGAGYHAGSVAPGRDAGAESGARLSRSETAGLVRVEAKFVCMPNNKHFQKEQIPIEIDNKMYYGCCKMCVNMLKLDPKVRTAVDPVSGKQVDKAVAVIGAASDNKVYYFENEQNLKNFRPGAGAGE